MDLKGAKELFQAQSHLYKHVLNFITSMSLNCIVKLGIPGIIDKHDQAITLPQLVSALNIHPTRTSSIHRLMRLMVHSGFFATTKVHNNQEEEEEAYILAPPSMLLLKDEAISLSPFVLALLDPVLITPWHCLADWMQGNKLTAFESAHGMALWDYAEKNPDFGNLCHEAMASDSQMIDLVVSDCKPIFEGLGSLVDVGGGTGSLARVISKAFPHLKCTVLDLPHVVANLPESENLKYIGGDMFQSIPSADATVIKWVLHNWRDEDCVNILKNCREAIPSKDEGGKLIIIDMVISEKKDDHELIEMELLFDMLMLANQTGRQRNRKEWEKLFLEAGFSDYKITHMFGSRSIIEVSP